MSNAARDKGLRAEREIAGIVSDLTGWDVRRMVGAGFTDDIGDLAGVPDTTVQVANWPSNTLSAYVTKPDDAETQRNRAQTTFAVTFVRHKGGMWRAAMTLPQWATWAREATR